MEDGRHLTDEGVEAGSKAEVTPAEGSEWYEEPLPPDHRSGFVAVVGRPNVGKSTLINAYLGQKISIVSPKPQTTRNRLLGILTLPQAQIIFVDTPGIHQPKHKLGQYMVEAAQGAMPDADVALFMVDLTAMPSPDDRLTAEMLRSRPEVTVILALNKVDLVRPADLQAHVDAYLHLIDPTEWMLLSAIRGDNRDKLLEVVIGRLPEGPRYYPPEQVTDQQERFIAGELIREQILLQTREEIPHAVAVVVEEFKERREGLTYVSATVYVERDSQKKIIIGNKGDRLKQVGQAARRDVERLVGHQVYLELWVKVRKKWREDEQQLRDLGYVTR